MDLKNIINKKGEYADYMLKEITHICKDMDKRDPGSKGEKQACEYMADVLKNECGCERADVESFKENPGSFFGWIYFTITFVLAAVVLFFWRNASQGRQIKKRKTRHMSCLSFPGAGDEARTRYLHLGKVALYQMSYTCMP